MADPAAPAPVVDAITGVAPAPVAAPAPAPAVEAAPAPAPAAPEPVPTLVSLLSEVTPEPVKPEVPAEPAKAEAVEAQPDAPADPAKVEPKPEELKPEVKAEEKPVETPAPEPVEKPVWKIELPEVIKADEKQINEFTSLLDALVSPSETLTREQAANSLMAMHAKAMQDYAANTDREQRLAFNKMREGWRNQILADEEVGGSGFETAKKARIRMRDEFVSSAPRGSERYKADLVAFNTMLDLTGAGDHVAMHRFMQNVAARLDEPRKVPAPDPRPPKDIGPGPRDSRNSLYDHPRSPS